ncbi:MAG: TlpA disulfide reductase family protein [Gemmatimonadaceae bacterium]
MTAKQQWIIVAAVVALMAGGAATASHFLGEELTPVTVGSKAPVFAGVTIDEKPMIKTLNDYKGEVVLLNVWATTCAPCREEMPSIEKLYKDYQPKGLKIVAVSTDLPGMSQSIRDFAKEYGLTFDILYDSLSNVHKQYQIYGWPYSFIISRDGVIHKKWIGPDDWNSSANRKLIDQLLAEAH